MRKALLKHEGGLCAPYECFNTQGGVWMKCKSLFLMIDGLYQSCVCTQYD